LKTQDQRETQSQKLAKQLRLKKKKDFQFSKFKRFKTDLFCFVFTKQGKGRLGISLSKKVLSSAVARNRIKRLLREVFRRRAENFPQIDLNVLGSAGLSKRWKSLDYVVVSQQFEAFEGYLKGAKADE